MYNHAIRVSLNPSDPQAKIFYSFNPDGGPNDALAYTGQILLKSSTPLVYFGFVSMENESKVLIDDYVFDYPNTINFAPRATRDNDTIKQANIFNSGTGDLDISFWEIHAQNFSYIIPENTIIQANSNFALPDIPLSGGQSVLLSSPDGEQKDILTFDELMPTVIKSDKAKIITKPKTYRRTIVRELPAEIWIKPQLEHTPAITSESSLSPSASASTTITPSDTGTASVTNNTPVTAPTLLPAENQQKTNETPLSDNLKNSTLETGTASSRAPWIVLAGVILAGSVFGMRFMLMRKK